MTAPFKITVMFVSIIALPQVDSMLKPKAVIKVVTMEAITMKAVTMMQSIY